MNTIERLTENPFICALLITILIALIFYTFTADYYSELPERKVLTKAFIYMYLGTLFLLHMHARSVKAFYDKKIGDKLRLTAFNRTGSSELEVPLNSAATFSPQPQPQQTFATNEFI